MIGILNVKEEVVVIIPLLMDVVTNGNNVVEKAGKVVVVA